MDNKNYYNLTEYERAFYNVGEWYLTDEGVVYVFDICKCESCQQRGFNEPIIINFDRNKDPKREYLMGWDAKGFIDRVKDRTFDKSVDWVQEGLNHSANGMQKRSEKKFYDMMSEYIDIYHD